MRKLLVMALSFWPIAAPALPWSKDMVDQPSVKAQEATVAKPEHNVPVDGGEPMPVPRDVAEVVHARLEAARNLLNPQPSGEASVTRGKEVYDTHCLVCHGASGKGDGPVGRKFVPPPMDLTTDYVQLQADGQIFYTITHGGVAMPFYRDAIDAEDRWHLINYIKTQMKPE